MVLKIQQMENILDLLMYIIIKKESILMRSYKEYVDKNKIVLQKALDIDNNKWDEKNTLEDIINKEQIKVNFEENKAYLVVYEGQPEITIKLIEEAINSNSSIVFTIKDYYLAINKILIEIANKCILENKKQILFKLYNNINEEKIYEASEISDKTIYIGNKEDFDYIKKNIKGETIFIEYE